MRTSKNDHLVQRVKPVQANPMYARVRYDDGRKTNVSLRDLARFPGERNVRDGIDDNYGGDLVHNEVVRDGELLEESGQKVLQGVGKSSDGGDHNDQNLCGGERELLDNGGRESGEDGGRNADFEVNETNGPAKRRVSMRINKGVPPNRFDYQYS